MTRKLIPIICVALAAVAAFAITATVLDRGRAAAPRVPTTVATSTLSLVIQAQERLREAPDDVQALATLASASLERFRETGDPTWYTKTQEAADRALTLRPDLVEALDAHASLANSRHRFAEGLRIARRSMAIAPDRFAPLGTAADALIELGRYDEGFALIDRRLALRPDGASYSRASYAAELRGDRELAIELMTFAVDATRAGSEFRAWTRVELGKLHLGSGDVAAAEREMRQALAERPDDARVLAGLGQVLAARGRLADAAARYERALELMPLPEYAVALHEIDQARGEPQRATDDLAFLAAMERLLAANGVRVDLERSLVDADLGRVTGAAIARARAARALQPGILGDDALGWTLTRAGRCPEGLRYARASLRLGTRDARLLFHAGAAAHCAGERGEAARYLGQALDLNPNFSVRWAPVARRMLAEVTP